MFFRHRGWAAVLVLAALFFPGAACRRQPRPALEGFVVEHPVPLEWKELGPGLWFARLEFRRQSDDGRVVVAAVRAEPERFDFDLLDAPALVKQPLGDLEELADRAGSAVAVNASFYLPESYKPIGLIVSDRKVENAWKKGAGSGVFWVKDGQAAIDWAKSYRKEWAEAELALQAGPLVIEPGGRRGIRSNAQKLDSRTAIGLDDRHRVVLACTLRQDEDGETLRGIDLYELMTILSAGQDRGGLGLRSALNLDGGTSTAFLVRSPGLTLLVKSLRPVRNGIGLRPRGEPWK